MRRFFLLADKRTPLASTYDKGKIIFLEYKVYRGWIRKKQRRKRLRLLYPEINEKGEQIYVWRVQLVRVKPTKQGWVVY